MKLEESRLHRAVGLIRDANWEHRPGIRDVRDWLKAQGVIAIDVDAQEIELTRDILRVARRAAEKEGDIGRLPFAMDRIDPETGEKAIYWAHNDEMTPEEAARHTAKLDRKIAGACKQRAALHKYRVEQHGDAYQQALFDFKHPATARA